jgi:hypothetical protein
MFVLPVELVAIVQAAVTNALVPVQRKRFINDLQRSGVAADGADWLRRTELATVAALEKAGEATGAEMSKLVPELGAQMVFPEGTVGVTTRMLFLLSTEQKVARGRPKGAWTSSQWRWSPMSTWLPDGIPDLPADAARAELAHRWLLAFGPAPVGDLKWWTGWTVGATNAALAKAGAETVELDDGSAAFVAAGDSAPVRATKPWIALLPALDPTPMGWQQRDWYLGEHRAALFDRSGNIGPTVWSDGHIVGGWAQRPSGEVVVRLLEDAGASAAKAIDAEAARLTEWLGAIRVRSRFPTPLEKELAASHPA